MLCINLGIGNNWKVFGEMIKDIYIFCNYIDTV